MRDGRPDIRYIVVRNFTAWSLSSGQHASQSVPVSSNTYLFLFKAIISARLQQASRASPTNIITFRDLNILQQDNATLRVLVCLPALVVVNLSEFWACLVRWGYSGSIGSGAGKNHKESHSLRPQVIRTRSVREGVRCVKECSHWLDWPDLRNPKDGMEIFHASIRASITQRRQHVNTG